LHLSIAPVAFELYSLCVWVSTQCCTH
jgi:hypothetical protein